MRAMDGQAATTGSGDVSAPREPTSPLWREDDVEAGGRREPDGERTARRSAAPESPPARRDGNAVATPAAGGSPRSSLGMRSYYDLRARSSLGTFRDLIRRQASADDDGTGDTVSRSYRLPSVLLRMPNTAFGMPMGLAAHAIMWRSLGRADRLDSLGGRDGVLSVGRLCWYSACVTGGTAAALYGYKIVTSFSLVRAEYLNEVRCHFFNAPNLIFIMLLLGVPDDVEVSDGGEFFSLVVHKVYWFMSTLFGVRRRSTNIFFRCRSTPSTVGLFILLPCYTDEQHIQNVDVQQAEELHRCQASVSDVDGWLVLAEQPRADREVRTDLGDRPSHALLRRRLCTLLRPRHIHLREAPREQRHEGESRNVFAHCTAFGCGGLA
mmetsp:Transcript_5999/g.12658  ORF Transcript_5999/g.12658 Transcript_5999/m.12658 type:complete len:380 (-) Transcript_5999:491-1630(-)